MTSQETSPHRGELLKELYLLLEEHGNALGYERICKQFYALSLAELVVFKEWYADLLPHRPMMALIDVLTFHAHQDTIDSKLHNELAAETAQVLIKFFRDQYSDNEEVLGQINRAVDSSKAYHQKWKSLSLELPVDEDDN